MMVRRSLTAVFVVGFVLTAGCLGVLTGSQPLQFSASPATVSDEALTESGYVHQESRALYANQTPELAGQEREVIIRNQLSTYARSVAGQEVAFAVILSTPDATVAGQSLNPIARIDERQLLTRVATQSGQLRGIEEQGQRSMTILGTQTAVVRFEAVAQREGQPVDVIVHVTRVAHEGDYLVAVVLYPANLPEGEADAMALLSGLQH